MAITVVAYAQEATPEPTTAEAAAGEGEAVVAEAAPVEASTNPLTPLGINVGFLLAQILNFGLLFFLLGTIATVIVSTISYRTFESFFLRLKGRFERKR